MSPLSSALSGRSRSWPRIAVLPFTGLSIVPSAEVLPLTAGNLKLSRPGAEPGLRAWDAADELLLAEAGNRLADSPRVLVVDDQFGALTLGLAQAHGPVTSVADSESFRMHSITMPDIIPVSPGQRCCTAG